MRYLLLMRLLMPWLLTVLVWFGAWLGLTLPTFAQSAADAPPFTQQTIQGISELRNQAFATSQTGQFEEAERLWTELLTYFPDEPAIWSNRGNVRVSQNKLLPAIEDYTQAIELAPQEPDPYLNRGAALEGLGRWEDAIADYTHLLELSPKDAAAYNNLGNAKSGLGQWQAALEDYQTASRLDPTFAFARVNAALVTYQIGEVDEAIRQLRSLTRKYPSFPDARAALTAALWQLGQHGEAESNWVAVTGLDTRYRNLDWVRTVRRWPPAIADALEQFVNL